MKSVTTKKRWVSTCFWKDPWVVESLDPPQKLLFLYLITNERTNVAGVYEVALKTIANETGLEREAVRQYLHDFSTAGKVLYLDPWVILKNTLKHQKGDSEDIKTGIQRVLDSLPPEVRKAVEDFRGGLSIDYPPKVPPTSIHSHPNSYSYSDSDLDLDLDLADNMAVPRKGRAKSKTPSAAVPATSARPLYHLLLNAFLAKSNGSGFDYKREGPHIKQLEKKALIRAGPPPPEEFCKMLLVTFWQLIHSEDKFWKAQPFLPSVLNSGGIYPRVLKAVENLQAENSLSREQEQLIRGMFHDP